MKKIEVVQALLGDQLYEAPRYSSGTAFAPTNIALCKYWGKRDSELNLPKTSSLSISLADKGAVTTLDVIDAGHDQVILNNKAVDLSSAFSERLLNYLDLFREHTRQRFAVNIQVNIPVAAGLASSACGFASLTKALNEVYGWELSVRELSILSRLGSGSACRSLWQGFVVWNEGVRADGMDSHGELLLETWPELCVGLLLVSDQEKKVSSREAMQRTIETSPFYAVWPPKARQDLLQIKAAITKKDFKLLGQTAEANALAMHAMMLSAWPPIQYANSETLILMQKIWNLRASGLEVYFTQDAGPNLKLLFLEKDSAAVNAAFSGISIAKSSIG